MESDKIQLDKFNFASPPAYDIYNIKWDYVKAIGVSDSGACGVIFVETLFGSFVIKGSNDPAIEYFCYLFYKNLRINIPKTLCFEFCDEEYKKIDQNMHKFLCHDDVLNNRVHSRLSNPFFLVMQYMAGNTITSLGPKKAEKYMSAADKASQLDLIEIGKVVATDTLVNMVDRYPMIWDNDGNPENLIFNLKTKHKNTSEELKDFNNTSFGLKGTVAIDNRPFMYWHKNPQAQKNYELYLEKFSSLVKELMADLDSIMSGNLDPKENKEHRVSALKKLSKFIQNNTGYDIGAKGEFYILLGMAIGYINAIDYGYENAKVIYDNILSYAKEDWKNTWKDNLKSINIEMVKDTIAKAKEAIGDRTLKIIEFLSRECDPSLLLRNNEAVSPEIQKKKPDFESLSDEVLMEQYGINHDDIKHYKERSEAFDEAWQKKKNFNADFVDERERLAAEARARYIESKKQFSGAPVVKLKKAQPKKENN